MRFSHIFFIFHFSSLGGHSVEYLSILFRDFGHSESPGRRRPGRCCSSWFRFADTGLSCCELKGGGGRGGDLIDKLRLQVSSPRADGHCDGPAGFHDSDAGPEPALAVTRESNRVVIRPGGPGLAEENLSLDHDRDDRDPVTVGTSFLELSWQLELERRVRIHVSVSSS